MSPRRLAGALSIGLAAALGARCGDGPPDSAAAPPVVSMVLDLSGDGTFYDLGFPTDLRLDREGRIELDGFPRQDHPVTERYVRVVEEDVRGWAPATALYLRFDGPLDATALPRDPAAYLAAGAPLVLVDVDERSPERGRRFPLEVDFVTRPDTYRPAHLLEALPVLGIRLRERTTYALFATRDLPVPDGARLGRPPALAALLAGRAPPGDDALVARAIAAFVPLRAHLALEGRDPDTVVAATVFTTGAPSERLVDIAERLARRASPAPLAPLERTSDFERYCVLRGTWPRPVFQAGTLPFVTEAQGGVFQLDAAGEPVAQATLADPFVVTLPRAPMPASGFPLLAYHHGTGGRSTQVYERGRDPGTGVPELGGGPAAIAAERGFATSGFGGHLGSEHYDGPLALDGRVAYNFLHPRAMRDNYTQQVADAVLFRSVVGALAIDPALCPGVDASAAPDGLVRFDASRYVPMGQSLGSIVAGMAAAVDPRPVPGLILSGAGASWIESPFGVTDPIPLAEVVELLLGLPEGEALDRWHPMLTLAELAMGSADNVHLLPRLLTDAPAGRVVPHVLVIEGYRDEEVPENMQRALVAAIGVDLVGPDQPSAARGELLPRLALAGFGQRAPPVAGNRVVAGAGPRTAAVVHHRADGIRHGHHVAFQLDAPKHQYGCFLEDLAAGRVPTIVTGTAQGGACATPSVAAR